MYLIQNASGDHGLTFREILADIPHDAAAIFVYLLVALSIVVVWRANRPKSGAPPTGGDIAGRSDPAGSAPRAPEKP
jgi:hypothetical protein